MTTNNTGSADGKDNIPKLSEALADPEAAFVYREAQRQYDALLRNHDTPCSEVSLRQHYRSLFEEAAKGLAEDDRLKLLYLCFGYKRKWMILRFLDDLDESVFPWAPTLRSLVANKGRDSFFDEYAVEEKEAQQEYPTPQARRPSGYRMSAAREHDRFLERIELSHSHTAAPTIQHGRFFVIPTLCLAYPAEFCTAFASQAPLDRLNTTDFLRCPATALISLAPTLKDKLRADASIGTARDASWDVFFDHLLLEQKGLFEGCFRRPVLDGGIAYDEEDLEMWLRKWFANRQMRGLRERGEEIRKEIRKGGTSTAFADDMNGAAASSKKKNVSWRDLEEMERA